MQTRQLFSLALSVIIVGTSVAAFHHSSTHAVSRWSHQPMMIDGRPVVNFAPVIVRPTAQQVRDAFAEQADASRPSTGTGFMTLSHTADSGSHGTLAGLTDAAFAMPYYSFGTPLDSISKD